ncbi:MAG: septum formation initiator family protein [Treponema sp.]|nr:septum formation initiator family protein [Treponema sp.]
MNKRMKDVGGKIFLCAVTIAIPFLLMVVANQSRKNADLKKQIEVLEHKQEDLKEKNKRLVGEIGQLTSVERIEKEAEDLGMKPATTEEIVRVDMNGRKK